VSQRAVASWIAPAVAYTALVGALGVTTKLALRSLDWPGLILWAAAVYAVIAVVLLVSGVRLSLGAGSLMGFFSGAIAAGALVLFFVALGRGEASRVIPVTSVYPVVTAVLAAAFLSERITLRTLAGTLLVIAG
jgi:transporter family protein